MCKGLTEDVNIWSMRQAVLMLFHLLKFNVLARGNSVCSVKDFEGFFNVLGGSSDGAKLKLYAQVFKHHLGK